MTSVATISHHQRTPVAKATKAQIQKHQNDLAYSILVHLGDVLYNKCNVSSLKESDVRAAAEQLKSTKGVNGKCVTSFDLNLIIARVSNATVELPKLELDAIDIRMTSLLVDIMEQLLKKPDLYSHLYNFQASKVPLLMAESTANGCNATKLEDSKLVQYEIIKRVHAAKISTPEYYKKPADSCCVIQ